METQKSEENREHCEKVKDEKGRRFRCIIAFKESERRDEGWKKVIYEEF